MFHFVCPSTGGWGALLTGPWSLVPGPSPGEGGTGSGYPNLWFQVTYIEEGAEKGWGIPVLVLAGGRGYLCPSVASGVGGVT